MSARMLRAVTFDDVGNVSVEYVCPDEDVRSNGLIRNHALLIPADGYDDGIHEVRVAVLTLLAAALADFAELPPLDIDEIHEVLDVESDQIKFDPDDDEAGPYDNPLERPLTGVSE